MVGTILGQQATNKSDEDNDGELREHVEELLQLNPPLYNSAVALRWSPDFSVM